MRVLLTGAAGFIGRQLFHALESAGHDVVPVVRRCRSDFPEGVVADLLRAPLASIVRGCDVVVHAASVTTGAEDELWQGNVTTTRRLVQSAVSAGARIVSLSTTGVYGRSVGRFAEPRQMRRNPSSLLSRARAAAEDIVLDAGGAVIRPHVVFGRGDRWVVPRLTNLMRETQAWLGGPDVAVAAISSGRLAEGMTALLDRSDLHGAFHASEHRPVPVADLVRPMFLAAGDPLPTNSMSLADAYRRLSPLGVSWNALTMLGTPSSMNAADFWGRDS